MSSKERKLIVTEPHEIIESAHYLELSELRIIQLCLAKIFMKDGLDENTWYPVDKKLYAATFNVCEETAYEALVKAATQLLTRTITLKSSLLDVSIPETSKSKTVIHWASACRYNNDTMQLEIQWSPGIVYMFNRLGSEYQYSKYYLDHVTSLKSVYSMRLYRLLNRFGFCHYATLELEEFLKLMGISQNNEPSVYSEFKYLNRQILKPCIEDINARTNLIVSMSTIKLARKVHKLKFKINKRTDFLLD